MPTVTLLELIKPALRMAGITSLPGIIPSSDQTMELIGATNRMMSSFSLDGHKIYTTAIDRYALTPQQSTYFIGPTGDFVAPRPINIVAANLVVVSSQPELHIHLKVLTDLEWAGKTITELASSWPFHLYNDGGVPDSKLYLYPFPTVQNDLELFTPKELKDDFTAITDTVDLPPGYEEAITTNLALAVARLYPHEAVISDDTRRQAQMSLIAIRNANIGVEKLRTNAAGMGGKGGLPINKRSGFEKWGAGL